MVDFKKKELLFKKVSSIKGVGKKLSAYLKTKKIEKISDLLLNFPYSFTDRTTLVKTNQLENGKLVTIKLKVIKYNFPRKKNLPNTIICEDEFGKINLTYFNSNEFYLRNILKLNSWVVVSGKVNFFRGKYQITNPDYVTKLDKIDFVNKLVPKYYLTEGLSENQYRIILDKAINNIPSLKEWIPIEVLRKEGFLNWKDTVLKLHSLDEFDKKNSYLNRRLVFDEILAHFISLSKHRAFNKRIKSNIKNFKIINQNQIISNLEYELTNNQKNIIKEINEDLKSNKRMFRILQGDVGSGKTIVALINISNVIESGYQCAFMVPTDILARQHYDLALEIFKNLEIKVGFLTSKLTSSEKKIVLEKTRNGEIDLLIGTHSLFQKKIKFKSLGLAVVDEQHKFGVRQRMDLSKKGSENCDLLLMSATPIPRTMILCSYGDIEVSKLIEKPNNRKSIITYSKPENKISEIIDIVKKNIKKNSQVFWVCPLIKESKVLNFSSSIKRYDELKKIFKNQVGLIHGSMTKDEKETLLKKFLKKEIKILVSTTVIEVGINFPNANLIIIENADKFGLAQLHQLRGRVGRGNNQGICILVFKNNLSSNAIQRIKILKETSDGFKIADEDLKLRGFGNILGYQQSGTKYFKFADPIFHNDLFELAFNHVKKIESIKDNFNEYETLLKLFDKAEITFSNDDF